MTISGRSLRTVGSPPVICSPVSGPTFSASVAMSPSISSKVMPSLGKSALMKHTGHFALQRRVTSISTNVPRRRWRLHSPQLLGHSSSMR